jgi:hypothetical protein
MNKSVTIINLKTGESATGSLKVISKIVSKSTVTISKFKKEGVILFSNFAISFNHTVIKQPKHGNLENLAYRVREREREKSNIL